MSDMKIERAWGMPNKNTFDIHPIKKMLQEKLIAIYYGLIRLQTRIRLLQSLTI